MIKNIVFDLGGVLLTEDNNWLFSNETKKLLGVDNEHLKKAWNFAWPDARSGKIDEKEFFNKFLQSSVGSPNSDLALKLKDIYRSKSDKLETFELLLKLKKNYKLFALTNVAKDWLTFKINKFKLGKYFDLIISSCGEGIAKPDKEIFLSLIKKAKINPEESVLIDNAERNTKIAQKLDFQTILFESRAQLVKEMEKMGIKI